MSGFIKDLRDAGPLGAAGRHNSSDDGVRQAARMAQDEEWTDIGTGGPGHRVARTLEDGRDGRRADQGTDTMDQEGRYEFEDGDLVLIPDGAVCAVSGYYKVFGRRVYGLLHPGNPAAPPLGAKRLLLVGRLGKGQTVRDVQALAQGRLPPK